MNKKGFTLIELLAVVVVLGIIMVLSVTTVLPYMENARKQAFATEAEVLKKSAEQAVSLINIGQITNSYTKGPGDYCFTLDDLQKLGLFKKDNSKYNGAVVVRQSNNSYKYYVKLENGEYYILQSNASNIESSDVQLLTDELIADSANIFSCSLASEQAYAIYTESDKSLVFVKNDEPIKAGDLYNNKTVTEVWSDIENYHIFHEPGWTKYKDQILKVEVIDKIYLKHMYAMFKDLTMVETMNLENFDTSNVTDFSQVFYNTGFNTTNGTEINISNWDVSNATKMYEMFRLAKIASMDISSWDTSNVTDMHSMFSGAYLKDLDLSLWNTSNVTDMSHMFSLLKMENQEFIIGDISTKVVTKDGKTYTAWDVSNVTNMSYMFYGGGFNSTKIELKISNWDTSKVTDMSAMFRSFGSYINHVDSISLELSNWNTSGVTDMSYMFEGAGEDASSFTLLGISDWDTSNVTTMEKMFADSGISNQLDLSSWKVKKVTDKNHFALNAEDKIIPPKWIN